MNGRVAPDRQRPLHVVTRERRIFSTVPRTFLPSYLRAFLPELGARLGLPHSVKDRYQEFFLASVRYFYLTVTVLR